MPTKKMSTAAIARKRREKHKKRAVKEIQEIEQMKKKSINTHTTCVIDSDRNNREEIHITDILTEDNMILRSQTNVQARREDIQLMRLHNRDQNMNEMRGVPKIIEKIVSKNELKKRNTRKSRENQAYASSERAKNRERRRIERCNDILRHRSVIYNKCIRKKYDLQSKAIQRFIEERSSFPDYICSCCEGMFFQKGVVKVKKSNIVGILKSKGLLNYKIFNESVLNSRVFNYYDDDFENYFCHTCNKYTMSGRIPKLASHNGFILIPVPLCVANLNEIEERLVSMCIAFMQIRTMDVRASNPYSGIKGSVIHIPTDPNDMITMLPRSMDNLNLMAVPVEFKRNKGHASSYLKGLVRPEFVAEALEYLKNTELYKKYKCIPDPNFLATFNRELEDTDEDIDKEIDDNNGDENSNNKVTINNDSDDENFGFENPLFDDDDECLLLDFNEETAKRAVLVMAPGEYNFPVSAHTNPDYEYLSFTKMFGGISQKLLDKNINRTDIAKWEARYHGRKIPVSRLLYNAKMKLERDLFNSIQIALRKRKISQGVTANEALNENFIDDIVKHDDGFKFMKNLRCSPSHWAEEKKKLIAMNAQIGKPTFFLTFSIVETNCPELIQGLYHYSKGETITRLQALSLPNEQRYHLVKENPVYIAMYYHNRYQEVMKFLNDQNGPFYPYKVVDYYSRREFQQRGSPHEHILLSIEGAPEIDLENLDNNKKVIEFIDQFITCAYDPENPNCKYLRHKHTRTCCKGRRNKNTCRFNYPHFVLDETMILEPLDKTQVTKEIKQNLVEIRKLMETYYRSKDRVYKDLGEVLVELKLTKEQYVIALRSSISKLSLFYKRRTCDIDISPYNLILLNAIEANINLQFILDVYAVAVYIVDYIAKAEAGLSKGLLDLQNELRKGDRSLMEQYRCLGNKFINSNVMSVVEAAYHCLGTPLSKCSRDSLFINTNRKEDRVVFMKSRKALEELDPDSLEIAGTDIMTHYAKRVALDDICLAEYAAFYFRTDIKKRRDKNLGSDEGEPEENYDPNTDRNLQHHRRKKARILRFVRFKFEHDPDNFYREHILLFRPWRDEETEVESVDWEQTYMDNVDIILNNRSKLFALSDDAIIKAFDAAVKSRKLIEDEETAEFENDKTSQDQEADIFVQGGVELPKTKVPFIYNAPPKVDLKSLFDKLKLLNDRQREIVMHVYKCFKISKIPLYIYIAGSAGVGKSLVISVLYQLITYQLEYSSDLPQGQQNDGIKVLLCAFSGKAAFLIGGNTLHSAFALPLTECANMPDLPMDVANNLRHQLQHCKLIIIDEISMVGSTHFTQIDTRLRQITGVNYPFGGLSVIPFGDFLQLPPVKDSLIFKAPKHSLIDTDFSLLWIEFYFYELTEIMRQKDDLDFANALKSFATGSMTKQEILLIKTRETDDGLVPESAIRLYYTNADVERFNNERISASSEKEIKCVAIDSITGNFKLRQKQKKLKVWREKPTKDCGGYPYLLRLKNGIKYMVTANLDVSDGLVNGATGELSNVYCDPGNNKVKLVFLKFTSPVVGRKMRQKYRDFMQIKNIDLHLTPIPRKIYNLTNQFHKDYQASRDQFPLVPCEALTIHKSQGQTYENLCIDFRKSGNLTRQLVYVALSRVTKLEGLFILGTFPGNMKSNHTINASLSEMTRLRNEKKLPLLFNNLEKINGLIVAYLNCRSLKSNLPHILSDIWYQRCDVIIFSETCTVGTENIVIENFELYYRSDDKNCPLFAKSVIGKGLMCFKKCGIVLDFVDMHSHFKENNGKYYSHVDFFSFKFRNVLFITGYKSPKAVYLDFEKAFKKLFISSEKSSVLLGDFNFNLNDSENHQVKMFNKLMNSSNFKNVLPLSEPTTNLNSRLDIIFSSIPIFESGIYECYFSDHKPVFVEVPINYVKYSDVGSDFKPFLNGEVNELLNSELSNFSISEDEDISPEEKVEVDNTKKNENKIITINTTVDQIYDISDNESQSQALLPDELMGYLDSFVHIIKMSNNYAIPIIRENISEFKIFLDFTRDKLKQLPLVTYSNIRDRLYSKQMIENYREIVITGDGNCQFNALSYALVGNEHLSLDLRKLAVQSVIENEAFFHGINPILESGTYINLIEICCTNSAWGNMDTLFALGLKMQRHIYVVKDNNDSINCIKIEACLNSTLFPLVLRLHGAGQSNAHYNVLLPINSSISFDSSNVQVEIWNLQNILNELSMNTG